MIARVNAYASPSSCLQFFQCDFSIILESICVPYGGFISSSPAYITILNGFLKWYGAIRFHIRNAILIVHFEEILGKSGWYSITAISTMGDLARGSFILDLVAPDQWKESWGGYDTLV